MKLTLMRNILFFLLSICMVQPVSAATTPAALNHSIVTPMNTQVLPVQKNKAKKNGLFAKLKQKMVQYAFSKGMLVDGEPSAKQRRQAKWSLILGISSIVFIFLPYVALLAIPAAVVGLILGIKSLDGNNNAQGIIGIIASGLTLLLLLLAIALAAAYLASWN